MHKHLRILLLVSLSLASFIKGYGQTAPVPVPMASQTVVGGIYSYTENFSDVANWTANFQAGTGANRFKSVAIGGTGTIPNGTKTTISTATFSTSTSGGVQKGTGNLVFLAISSPDNNNALAVDFYVDFTGSTPGTLSFDWAAIANSTGNRAESIAIYTSTDGTNFTALPYTDPVAANSPINIANNVTAGGTVNVALPPNVSVIRFYTYNGNGGTTGSRSKISIDNLTVTATPTSAPPPPSDITPPVTTAGYPKAGNVTTTSVDFTNNLNEAGTTYYEALPAAAAVPSAAQVKAGQDASGTAVTLSGSFAVAAGTDAVKTISGLTASTAYKIYAVSQDAATTPNLQTTVTTTTVTTPAVTLANTSASYPKVSNITSNTVDAISNLNIAGTTYYVVLPATNTSAPSLAQIFAGQDGSGTAAFKSGSFTVGTANTDVTSTITGLTNSTAYNIYFASKNTAGDQQTLSTLRSITTPFAIFPFTNVVAPATTPVVIVGSGTTDPTPLPIVPGITFTPFTAVGVSAQPNAAGRFSFTAWPGGAASGNDDPASFTGVIDPNNFYYEVTVTPQSGKQLSLTSINFTVQRSSTGIRQFAVRSSLDNFASNLPASVNPTSATLTANSTTNIFQVLDANTSATAGSTITLGNTFSNLTNATVKFRFYGLNSEGNAGTFSIDDVNFVGSTGAATPPADVTPPVNAAGYPKATNLTNTSVALVTNLNETGTTYYVLIPNNGTAPTTAAQVMAGTDGAGNAALKAGTINVTAANTDALATISGLTLATAYKIYVVSKDAAANVQTIVATVQATTTGDTPKTDQHITLAATATATYGAVDIDPAATSDNTTIPVDYTSSDVTTATIVNNKVHILKAGTVNITASQAGNASYDPAASQQQVLTLIPKTLTVTANNQTRVYGAANPTLTITYTGFVNGDTQASLSTPATATTTATTTSALGTYDITPAGAVSNNYTFNYVNGKLTVTSNSRVLTFNSLPAKTYGNADFDPGATLSSGETPIYSTSDANVATIVNGKVHIVSAGNVTITAAAPANAAYGVTQPVSQFLIINKADQTINFASIPGLLSGSTYSLTNVISSSGLPVTFTVDDPFIAGVQGTTLNALTIGTATVIASVGANVNYNAASTSQQVKVTNVNGDELVVHQAVSPNGDGINDFLFIEGIQDHPVNKVTIVNGTGIKVFEVNNYSNTNSNLVFNGRSNVNGKQQVAGTYFYLIELNDGGKLNRKTGYFLLKY